MYFVIVDKLTYTINYTYNIEDYNVVTTCKKNIFYVYRLNIFIIRLKQIDVTHIKFVQMYISK